jgi:hypothetical protein
MWPFTRKRKLEAPRNPGELPSMVLMPVPGRFEYATLVDMVRLHAPDKKLVSLVEIGWTVSPTEAFEDIKLLHKFSDEPKLAMMLFSNQARLTIRASFMFATARTVRANTLQELGVVLSREAKSKGLLTITAR